MSVKLEVNYLPNPCRPSRTMGGYLPKTTHMGLYVFQATFEQNVQIPDLVQRLVILGSITSEPIAVVLFRPFRKVIFPFGEMTVSHLRG